MHLLAFLHKGVVLGDALERQLLHQVDDVGLAQELVLEGLDRDGEGGGVQQDLAVRVQVGDELFDDGLEFRGQQLVGLIHDERLAGPQAGDALVGEVEDAPGGGDDDVDGLVQAHDVVAQGGAARGDHDLDGQVLAQGFGDLKMKGRAKSKSKSKKRRGERDWGRAHAPASLSSLFTHTHTPATSAGPAPGWAPG